MILYYALGGGLGHLTRARAVVHTLGLGDVTLLTASPLASDPRVTGGLPVVGAPTELAADPAGWRDWLLALLDRLAPEALYLDAFPAGIRGELGDLALPPGLPLVHLARRLRWSAYREEVRGEPPPLALTYLLEPLEGAHEAFLRAHAARVEPLVLRDAPAALTAAQRDAVRAVTQPGRPLWLVVHSGPDDETGELVDYAADRARLEGSAPALVVVAPARPPGLPADVGHLDCYPASPLFRLADRLITAAGFNIMRQAAPYRARHWCLPFPRRFDDQFARAAAWRDGTMP